MTSSRATRRLRIGLLLFAGSVSLGLGYNVSQGKSAAPASLSRDTALLLDNSSGANWAGYGRTFGEQHFSPLTEINDANIQKLGLAWFKDLPMGISATVPLAIDGILYFTQGYSIVHAVDATTGRELWSYNPEVPTVAGINMRKGWGARGIGYWHNKIYVGTHDGRLIAIDAKTGKKVWSTQTFVDTKMRYITGAPRLFDGKVIIGHGGADVADIRGYVSAYDAETGKLAWRFYTVPGNPAKGFENKAMEMAAKTWSGDWWRWGGGGGTVWSAIAYDPDTDTVFIGTGNGSPWNHQIRSDGKGDNLFLCSIVALSGKTGAYKWHYQINPAESWDYNAAMDIELADLKIDGQMRKVLMTAPKNGFYYVIDRLTGKLISAEAFAKQNWAERIDIETGRPVEKPGIRYHDGTTFKLWPGATGAHGPMAMAFDPRLALAYIPVINASTTYSSKGITKDNWKRPGGADGSVTFPAVTSPEFPEEGTSSLLAWDPIRQKKVWEIPTFGEVNGGLLAVGGNVVFQGSGDGSFNAYASSTGKKLWSFAAQAPIAAGSAISYTAKGHQYITAITGVSGDSAVTSNPRSRINIDARTMERRVLTFRIDGKARLPEATTDNVKMPPDPDFVADDAASRRGAVLFGQNCSTCHGFNAISTGFAPDLRASSIPLSAEAFATIVKDGALEPAGMPKFGAFNSDQLDDLRAYIRARAHKQPEQTVGGHEH